MSCAHTWLENRVPLTISFYTVTPPYDALPAHLRTTDYSNPTNENRTAFQDGWKTQLTTFQWMGQNPTNLAYFNDYMAARREPELSWLSVYPIEKELQGWTAKDSDKVVYVNVGGGIGHQCKQFREKYPKVPGRVILQDLPHSIAKALPTEGVENMPHDFFQPQPIKGELDDAFIDVTGLRWLCQLTQKSIE